MIMKRNICFLILITSLFISCDYGVNIQIENNCTESITDLSITNGFNTAFLDSVKFNETKNVFLDFKSNRKHSDGNYKIKYKKGDEQYSRLFGYYSNGAPVEDNYIIKIYNDTIQIESGFD